MNDLYWAVGIVAILSAGACALSMRIARRAPRSVLLLILLGGFIAFAAYLREWADDLWIARLIPFSGVMILGNFTPIIAAALAGIAWEAIPGRWWRKAFIPTALVCFACWSAWRPLFAEPPRDGARWANGVWRQTNEASCSPAAAATFLNDHGIAASEAEMARLCRTTKHGTATLGLYRGLVLKTEGTPWRVEVVDASVDTAEELTALLPAIINCGLLPDAIVDPRYTQEWGWAPGVRHTVVLQRAVGLSEVAVADPAVGRERWSLDALRVLWHGEAIRLVKR